MRTLHTSRQCTRSQLRDESLGAIFLSGRTFVQATKLNCVRVLKPKNDQLSLFGCVIDYMFVSLYAGARDPCAWPDVCYAPYIFSELTALSGCPKRFCL